MCKLDLEFPRPRRCMQCENIEDQLAPVDDLAAEGGFEIAALRRSQRVVEDDRLRSRAIDEFLEFGDLSASDAGGGGRSADPLRQRCDHLEPGGTTKRRELGQ